MNDNKKPCLQFPFFGASYPDACCINGKLYDMDKCDENSNLYESDEEIPCPFCRTEEFIKYDPFNWLEHFYNENNKYNDIESLEKLAEQKTKEWYLMWIEKMREKYESENISWKS